MGFLSLSMWSATCAFIGTVIIMYSVITVLRLRGVLIWSTPPPSPESLVAALSDEDKEKIEKLRSSAILRHLNKYTTTLDKHNMTAMVSTTEEESTTCSSTTTKNSESESVEEQKQQVDIEEGTIHDDKTQYSHISVPLPGQQSCSNATERTSNKTGATTSLNDLPETRNVPNLCVICYEEYKITDKVCWASSSDCTHVFHEECIVRWLTKLGWMKLKERKEPENMADKDKCLNYDLDCPMCRGKFICKNHVSKNAAVAVAATTGDESV
mmetsp:Transcript_8193/g.12825  ORF Transcript_8193/g.12825 Transcript_8193/m.12825 type:complete len:269 (+) Transcript_8193:262-1068(+)